MEWNSRSFGSFDVIVFFLVIVSVVDNVYAQENEKQMKLFMRDPVEVRMTSKFGILSELSEAFLSFPISYLSETRILVL